MLIQKIIFPTSSKAKGSKRAKIPRATLKLISPNNIEQCVRENIIDKHQYCHSASILHCTAVYRYGKEATGYGKFLQILFYGTVLRAITTLDTLQVSTVYWDPIHTLN